MNERTTQERDGDLAALEFAALQAEQFRLTRLQTFNWGTFAGVVDIRIPASGYLFVGPSGSGKSTLLDAHTALLTPPKWVDFNVAAREAERSGKDRNLLTYMRGAWAQQTSDNGEHGIQYLRSGTTWTALAETYQNGQGRCVVLAQLLWIRGNSSALADVKRLYLVFQRELDLKELACFAESQFDVRRLKETLGKNVSVKEEFSGYQERFRSLLGIDSERALRLLHKTQSAKNLGDLNLFLRDFMLDPPETFVTADRLVSEFAELDAAHQAVVTAKLQIQTLAPARELFAERVTRQSEKSRLDEVALGIDLYREQKKHALLTHSIDRLGVEAQGASEEAQRLTTLVDDAWVDLLRLKESREGLGGALAGLERQLKDAREQQPLRRQQYERASEACQELGLPIPANAPEFVNSVAAAKERLDQGHARRLGLEERTDELKERRRATREDFEQTRREIEAMERQPSNIPAHMLALRAEMARALGIAADKLPFVGELVEVKKDATAWRGAIERVLHGFALSLLVDDKHYAAVTSYVNDHHFGGNRVVYFRVLPHDGRRRGTLTQSSLVRKLSFAEAPHAAWLREELSERFDYECAESLAAFRNASKAVTQAGQVKHSHARHEKDDRHRVDDRKRWVLGFDNREKLALYRERAGELGAEYAKLEADLSAIREEAERDQRALLFCQTLSNLTWAEVDVASLAQRVAILQGQVHAERAARPELETLDARIRDQEAAHEKVRKQRDNEEVRKKGLEAERAKLERQLATLLLERLEVELTPTQQTELEQRFAALGAELALENLEASTRRVERAIQEELKQLALKLEDLRHDVEERLREFNRRWPAESGGLDPVLASADDYFGKLVRLETDGLPRHEERFMKLLREQSDQNLTILTTKLDQERNAIRARLDLVNESLLDAPFNPGTHLVIEPIDRQLEEVRQFKQSLKQALSHSLVAAPERAEERFLVLRALVKRLSSQETSDKHWRDRVLDVRQHVEFLARELDENGEEVEIYRSGAGKSGGQRQKLAATCLAAALRYQLGGQERGLPLFATVVLDEAFDKADSDFTRMAMNIFKTFGFQMIVATPLKSVMTLEPFIGGACFVHIKDRKNSAMLLIDYDEQTKRLNLPGHLGDDEEAPVS